MKRDEITALGPGKPTDDAIATAMGWQPARARWINYWRDGKRIIRQWRPSTDWGDTGYLVDGIISHPLRTLRQISGRDPTNHVVFQAEVEALDHFGPGPLPIVYFRASAGDPKMAICKAFLLMVYGLYELKG
jgi:hypothetical protein